MIEPAIPPDEEARLAKLRDLSVLDTKPEREFDDIVAIARAIFDTPMAHLTLVDKDRQWLKSRIGLDGDEAPRSISFCAHAILRDTALVVPDTLEDPRFHDNPIATQAPQVRFYVGQPIRMADGTAIGTLCVDDIVPREEPTQTQLDALAALARLAADAFAWRKARK
jgi:GAF domain-containing protein